MKKILLYLMFILLFTSFASAEIQTLGTFKQGEDISLIQTCASCSFNNITSVVQVSPSSKEIIGNFEMTRVGSVYNFTLSAENITDMGEYIVNGIGDLDGVNTVWTYNFFVTADGFEQSQFPWQFSVIFVSFLFVIFGLSRDRYTIFQNLGGILLLIMGVLTLYPGYGFINWSTLSGKGIGFILIAIGFYFSIENSFSRDEQEERFSWGKRRDTEDEEDEE